MRLPTILLILLIFSWPRTAAGATCELLSGLTYATYVDGSGTTQKLLLDLLLPTDRIDPAPVVVWVHGGGWQGGTRAPIPSRAVSLCTSRGYAIASIDYRLTHVARWPAQIQDSRAAVRWLRSRASTYHLDPARFGAWGNSAGGHLAAMLATAGGVKTATVGSVTVDLEGSIGGNLAYSSRVQAAVSWYPLVDFLQERFYPMSRDPEASTSYEGKLIGGRVQDLPERTATANPATYASPDDPPLLVMHGTADLVAPFNQSELLVDAVSAAGAAARLYPVAGAQHAASYFDKAQHLEVVYDFFDAALEEPAPGSPPPAPPRTVAGGVRVEAVDPAATEAGDPGRFRVTRSGDFTAPLTVTYTISGTATHAADYAHLGRTVTILAGAASATFDVAPLEDDLREPSETVLVTLEPSTTYDLGIPYTAGVAIRDNDNDSARPTVSLSGIDRDASESGSAGAFMLTRTGSTTSALTVGITPGGTATNGVDYASVPASVTFPAGINRLTIAIKPVTDSITEGDEHVTLTVQRSAGIYVGPYGGASVTIADHVPAIPLGWDAADVGQVGVAGSTSERDGTFTVAGAGEDVWGTADAFHFAYRPLRGDGSIVARVVSIDGTQAWTKVGVMMRGSLHPSSAHAFMLVSLGKGLAFQRRTADGGTSSHTSGGSGSAPRWIKLARAGATITASVSTDGSAWTVVGSDTFELPSDTLVGLAVSSHDASRAARGVFDRVLVTDGARPLPDGWASEDIGSPGITGSASEAGGTFTVKGAGADIWGTADEFHFAYRRLTGDGTVVARVAALSGTHAWTKVGVMIRGSVAPDSAYGFMLVSAAKGLAFQRRTTDGGLATNTSAGTGGAPRWVRLSRSGPVLVASISDDGLAWTEVGRDTLALGAEVLVGLAVTSHDATRLATGTFDGVAVAAAP